MRSIFRRRSRPSSARAGRPLLAACVAALAIGAGAPQDWRALALASFDDIWQTISTSFPDPAFGGLDWRGVQTELRPRVQQAGSPEAARGVMREMLARLKRSHYVLLSAASATDTLPGDATVAIDFRISNDGAVVTRVAPKSPAEEAGLRPGMTIESIDGQAVLGEVPAPGADARTIARETWRRAFRAMHGASGSLATIVARPPGGASTTLRVRRAAEPGEVVQFGNLLPLHLTMDIREVTTPARRRAGFIGFSVWMAQINVPVWEAVDRFRRHDGLIFDLRGNPGGLAGMMRGIAGHVLSTSALLGNMQTREGLLKFEANPRLSMPDGRAVEPFAGPVAIIVDEMSASTSECFAGGLQSLGRARIFGRASAGQALPASTRRLPNGDVLMYAIGDFVTSTGRRLEGTGVVPDEVQPLDPRALAAGRDTALEAVLRWIDTQKKEPLAEGSRLLLSSPDLQDRNSFRSRSNQTLERARR